MNVQDMINALNRRVDDIVASDDAIEWFNAGINDMAQAVQASFPQLPTAEVDGTLSQSPVFPSKYHEIPVMYAAKLYKERDTSLQEAENFLNQYMRMRDDFVKYYEVPVAYRDDSLTQVFTATAGQTVFQITMDTFNYMSSNPVCYINGIRQDDSVINSVDSQNNITLLPLNPLNAGDAVSFIWEEHADLIEPPFAWWKGR